MPNGERNVNIRYETFRWNTVLNTTYAGSQLLLRRFGIERPDRVVLAGAFGATSGLCYAWIAGHTGLEARLIDKMLDACTGLSAEKSNELGKKIKRKVDEVLPTGGEASPLS